MYCLAVRQRTKDNMSSPYSAVHSISISKQQINIIVNHESSMNQSNTNQHKLYIYIYLYHTHISYHIIYKYQHKSSIHINQHQWCFHPWFFICFSLTKTIQPLGISATGQASAALALARTPFLAAFGRRAEGLLPAMQPQDGGNAWWWEGCYDGCYDGFLLGKIRKIP